MENNLNKVNWQQVEEEMHAQGYSILPNILSHEQCGALIEHYTKSDQYRKTITMERYRFGLGEYKYFKYPLPPVIQTLREMVYPRVVPIANAWMKALQLPVHYPDSLAGLHKLCLAKGQVNATVLILKYGKGGHNALHQDLYGDVFFPIQAVVFLNEPEEDYHGGEFVLTQQSPRAQSKAIVLRPKRGDMLVFTTNFRPVKGTRGYYKAAMKHGVSEVKEGERHALGIIFHDALT